MKSTFIVWARYDRRPDLLARQLGATIHYISYGRRGSLLHAPIRYLLQGIATWRALCQERPDIIFVQNPPIFSVVLVYLYTRIYDARYVIDSHSGAFVSPKWRWSIGLHRFLSRRAVTTIVQNRYLAEVARTWEGRVSVLGFTPGDYPVGANTVLDGGADVHLAVISTGAEDEPLDVIFGAARALPDVYFYVTGDTRRVRPRLLADRPDNCRLTGYLPYDQYIGLLRNVDAVIDLTTRNYTLLMGAYEAVSLGTPLIISDWPVLREYFSQGAIHVPNTVEGIREGVRRVQRDRAMLRADIVRLHDQLYSDWTRGFSQLQLLLAEH